MLYIGKVRFEGHKLGARTKFIIQLHAVRSKSDQYVRGSVFVYSYFAIWLMFESCSQRIELDIFGVNSITQYLIFLIT